mmetsp:Transcript_11999/g.20349  ORF Transcript_11999/g.20349 Transcript_11999/m.20349 type:complete len:116 (-) Transcript_11999:1931-2278(-)
MTQVGEVDAVLTLVDKTNFCKYLGGGKLSSSVTWALGLQKPIVIYMPLAEVFVFDIPEDNATYWHWHYSNAASFSDAFGDCLNELERKWGQRTRGREKEKEREQVVFHLLRKLLT